MKAEVVALMVASYLKNEHLTICSITVQVLKVAVVHPPSGIKMRRVEVLAQLLWFIVGIGASGHIRVYL